MWCVRYEMWTGVLGEHNRAGVSPVCTYIPDISHSRYGVYCGQLQQLPDKYYLENINYVGRATRHISCQDIRTLTAQG